jgi:hypothetical protein
MANIDYRASAFGSAALKAPAFLGKTFVACKKISFAVMAVKPVQNDIVYIATIPARCRIISVDMLVITPEGEAATINVGDFSDLAGTAVDADGWLKTASINGATGAGAGTGDNTEAYGAAGGKFYPAASYLALTAVTAVTYNTAVIELFIRGVQYPALLDYDV